MTSAAIPALRCAGGGALLPPGDAACRHCHGTALSSVALPGAGRLYTYTVIHAPPAAHQAAAPYPVLVVELTPPGGSGDPTTRFLVPGRLDPAAAEPVPLRIGMPLRFSGWQGEIPLWTPDRQPHI